MQGWYLGGRFDPLPENESEHLINTKLSTFLMCQRKFVCLSVNEAKYVPAAVVSSAL